MNDEDKLREKIFDPANLPADIESELTGEPIYFQDEREIYRTNLLGILMDLIGKELHRLTVLQRKVMFKLYFQELSTTQIGKDLHVSQPAIMNIKERAVKTLRRRLSENPYFIKIFHEYRKDDPPIELLIKISNFIDGKGL
jgi:DNA-directed RNA polymerase specialized sigma subunit